MLLVWLSLSEEKVSSMTPDCLEKDTLATQLQEAQVGLLRRRYRNNDI